MTVNELIDRLVEMPMESKVYVYTGNKELDSDSFFKLFDLAYVKNFVTMNAADDECILYLD